MNMNELNALALKNQREHGTARRYVDITNPVNYPLVGRVGRVFGPGFFEQITSLSSVNCRVLDHDVRNSFLIGKDAV